MSQPITTSPASPWLLGLLYLTPALHPLLIPLVGVPSHLLWWIHVLPVAVVSFQWGRRGALGALIVSALLTLAGERIFGAGYGQPADWATVGSLTIALTLTNLLVAGFALYARRLVGRYEVLFDASSTGIVRINADHRIEAINPAALSMLGLARESTLGRTLTETPGLERLPDPDRLVHEGWRGTVDASPGVSGHEIHLIAAAAAQDDPPGYQILLVDRTEAVAHEREMERQSHLATLGEALAGVAHEMNNPLSVITAWSSIIADPEVTPEDLEEGSAIIEGQAARMKDLVQELLGYSRTRRHDDDARVHDVVERVLRMERVALGVGVRLEEEIGWRGTVAFSAGKIEQILVNLVANAAQAAPDGEGVVRVAVEEGDPDHVVIRVMDNGPGIEADHADRIFEPFFTTKPEGVGTGLGLAISRRLAHSVGGEISAAQGPLGGACFTLRLPKAVDTDGPEEPVPGLRRLAGTSEAGAMAP